MFDAPLANPVRIATVLVHNRPDPTQKGPYEVEVQAEDWLTEAHARRARRAVRLLTQFPDFAFEAGQETRTFQVDVTDEPTETVFSEDENDGPAN